jgi:hypothetical protein
MIRASLRPKKSEVNSKVETEDEYFSHIVAMYQAVLHTASPLPCGGIQECSQVQMRFSIHALQDVIWRWNFTALSLYRCVFNERNN